MESYSSNRPLPFNKSLLIDRSISARPLSRSTCLAFSRMAKRLASNSASFKSSGASFVSSLLVINPSPADTPRVLRGGGSRRSLFAGAEGHEPRSPPQQFDQSTVGHLRRLGEPLVRLRVVQTELAIPGAPDGGLPTLDPAPGPCRGRRHKRALFLIDHWNKQVRHHAISPFRVGYNPFAADQRSGDLLGRRTSRPLGRHARLVQLPWTPLPGSGQASQTVALVWVPVASRTRSQAHPFLRDGCLTTAFQVMGLKNNRHYLSITQWRRSAHIAIDTHRIAQLQRERPGSLLPGYSLLKFAHALPFEYVQQILMQVADSGERRW